MLDSIGWIAAHRFLFSQLRAHLLGWPACLAPAGRRITLAAASPTSRGHPQSICMAQDRLSRLSFGAEVFPMDAKAEKLALFRYGVIASLVSETLPRGELTHRAQEIAARHYDFPDSKRTAVAVDTLLDWAGRYRNGGFEALAPKPRQDRRHGPPPHPPTAPTANPRTVPAPPCGATSPCLPVKPPPAISPATRYRFLQQRGLSERQLLAPQAHQKFAAELSHQIWQADMLFGPWVRRPSGGRMQALLHATLDDASRLIPQAQFYASQGLHASLDCLRHAVAGVPSGSGVPIRLSIDHAKIYRSPQLARIAAPLGTLIVHSRPYQPEGHGKIEPCFRTVREQFLAKVDPKHPLSLDELNDRLRVWIESVYHRSQHSALGTTPRLRWQRDIEQVRQLPPSTDLRRLFFHRLDRLVRRDSTFLPHHLFYEAPPHLAGHTIEVRFDPLDSALVEIWFQGKLQATARPVDPVVNGQLPFVKPTASPEPEPTGINFVELLKQKNVDGKDEE